MRRRNSKLIPQRHTNKGAPAAGKHSNQSFDEATHQGKLRRLVFARIGDMARSRPGGLDRYPAVMPNYGGQRTPPGRGVTAGKKHRDIATYGKVTAGGDMTMTRQAEAIGISPSVVMSKHAGVTTAKVPSALAGRRRRRRG